jgi:cytochrome c-type biogenesis protein CcmH/NrfG
MSVELDRAEALLNADQHRTALGVLSSHLAADPDNVHALCLISRALLGVDDAPGALNAARRASALAPGEEWPARLISVAAMRMGDYGLAAAAADESIRLAPSVWQTHQQRAQVDLVSDHVDQHTWQVVREAVRLAPNEPTTHRLMGVVALEMRDHDVAEQALRTALRLDPQDTVAVHEMARLHLKRRNLGAAAAGFADVAALDPTSTVAVRNLAVVAAGVLRIVHLVLWAALFITLRVNEWDSAASRPVIAGCAVAAAVALGVFFRRFHQQTRGQSWRLLRIVVRVDRLLGVWLAALLVGLLGFALAAIGHPSALADVGVGVAAAGVIIGALVSWIRVARLRRQDRAGR